MNFDVYDLNKIFYDHIVSLPSRRKYGFHYWGAWNNLESHHVVDVSLNFHMMNMKLSWRYAPFRYSFNQFNNCYDFNFYQIDQHHLVQNYRLSPQYYFFIHMNKRENKENIPISLRELALFMIYMKHLSNI